MNKYILVSFLFFCIFSSCEKAITTYDLNFSAEHGISETNMFTAPGAYYSWRVEDEDGNYKFERNGSIAYETITGSTTAETGDWIFVYISVYDVFCYGSVSCQSSDGEISLSEYTSNSLINASNSVTAERVAINGIDTVIPVSVKRFQIK